MASSVSGFTNTAHGVALAEGNIIFALALHKALVEHKGADTNVIFSPASIGMAMAMTYVGMRGKTAAEVKEAMALTSLEDEHLHVAFQDLKRVIMETGDNYTLHIANRLFLEESYGILDDFKSTTLKHYSADSAAVSFKSGHEAARQGINKWVLEQTKGKIQDLMPQGSIDGLTRLVIANAVYFKGDWSQKFNTKFTKPGPFTLASGEKITTDMMFQKDKFYFGFDSGLNAKVIELPYKGDKMSMFMLLPNTAAGLEKLTEALTPAQLLDPRTAFKLRHMEVHVTIPKFKVEMAASLPTVLQSLGIKDLFAQGAADLSGIDGSRELYVQSVQHKAFIEVNEEGSEAAAATAIFVNTMSTIPQAFTAEHPFLYFIRENATRTILFCGVLQNPVGAPFNKEEL